MFIVYYMYSIVELIFALQIRKPFIESICETGV